MIGIFDRSHYEDVLSSGCTRWPAGVSSSGTPRSPGSRPSSSTTGTALVKCFLHISYDEQRERLLARLDDPDKHWKFNAADVDERERWADYQEAYRTRWSAARTDAAPWYVVPADRKWYRNWAVGRLLLETVRDLDPRSPDPTSTSRPDQGPRTAELTPIETDMAP